MYKPDRCRKVIAEGHRGYAAKYPENTLASFKAAMDLGVDQIEFDIWLSKDGVPVIMHDENAKRTTGVDRLITEMTLEEIKELDAGRLFDEKFAGEKVPTLYEILTLFSQNPKLYLGVEIKGDNKKAADAAVKMLREFNMIDNCWFYAWDATVIKYLKQQHGVRTMGYPDFIMMNLEGAPDYYDYCDEIGLPGDFLSNTMCNKIFADGKTLRAFCMDSEETVIYAVEHGAHAITANDPVPLIEYLEKHGMRIHGNNSYIKQSDKIEVIADCRENEDFEAAVKTGAEQVIFDAESENLKEKLSFIVENSDMHICLDIKGNEQKSADGVMSVINELGCPERISIYTKNTVMLKYIKKTYGVHTVANPAYFMEEIEENRDFYDYRDEAFIPCELISEMLCKKIQGKGKKMIMAVPMVEAEIEDAIEHGAYALISKEPLELIKYLEAKNLRY